METAHVRLSEKDNVFNKFSNHTGTNSDNQIPAKFALRVENGQSVYSCVKYE